MKKDIIVSRAKKVIKFANLQSVDMHKRYRNKEGDYYSGNNIKKDILDLAENEHEQNYLFVNKVLKQINLLLL